MKPKAKGIRSQEVEPTSDGGGHASDHPEGESGAQSEDVQVKDRGRGKRKAVDISREKDG